MNPLVVFSFGELKKITGNFKQDNILGIGGFGSVYKGVITEELREGLQHLQVAVKVHDGDNSYQGHRESLAEVMFLGQLSHPNLVKLIGYCCEDKHLVLVYELMARGSVEFNLFSSIYRSYPHNLLLVPFTIGSKCSFSWAIRICRHWELSSSANISLFFFFFPLMEHFLSSVLWPFDYFSFYIRVYFSFIIRAIPVSSYHIVGPY